MEIWEDRIGDEMWEKKNKVLHEAGTKVRGKTKRGRSRENETWRWGEEVQNEVKKKKKAYKALKDGSGNQEEYKKWKKEGKRAVARAKEKAWKEWYEKLDEGRRGPVL